MTDPSPALGGNLRSPDRMETQVGGSGALAFWLSAGGLGLILIGLELTVVTSFTAGMKGNHGLWVRYFLSLAMPVATGIVSAVLVRRRGWGDRANRRSIALGAAGAQLLLAALLAIVAWREWRLDHVFTVATDAVAVVCFLGALLIAFSLVRGIQLRIPAPVRAATNCRRPVPATRRYRRLYLSSCGARRD